MFGIVQLLSLQPVVHWCSLTWTASYSDRFSLSSAWLGPVDSRGPRASTLCVCSHCGKIFTHCKVCRCNIVWSNNTQSPFLLHILHFTSLWCTLAAQHCFFPTDKKPFINFVLSLFSQPLTLDGRWSYFNRKQDVIRLNSENLFYLKETNRTVSPMAALNKGKKKKIINAGSYLHLKTPNLCEFWSFLAIWTYFTRWQRR